MHWMWSYISYNLSVLFNRRQMHAVLGVRCQPHSLWQMRGHTALHVIGCIANRVRTRPFSPSHPHPLHPVVGVKHVAYSAVIVIISGWTGFMNQVHYVERRDAGSIHKLLRIIQWYLYFCFVIKGGIIKNFTNEKFGKIFRGNSL